MIDVRSLLEQLEEYANEASTILSELGDLMDEVDEKRRELDTLAYLAEQAHDRVQEAGDEGEIEEAANYLDNVCSQVNSADNL